MKIVSNPLEHNPQVAIEIMPPYWYTLHRMQVHEHKDKFPKIIWNHSQPMTDQELVALAAKCLLASHPFQEHTFFNEDSWYGIGTLKITPLR